MPTGRQSVRAAALLTVTLIIAAGCSINRTYLDTSLNNLSVGMSKDAVLTYYAFTTPQGARAHGMKMRATRQTERGSLLEVGEVPLWDRSVGRDIPYWLLFENGKLIQWGRPEDWRSVAARYQIDFNPSPGISR